MWMIFLDSNLLPLSNIQPLCAMKSEIPWYFDEDTLNLSQGVRVDIWNNFRANLSTKLLRWKKGLLLYQKAQHDSPSPYLKSMTINILVTFWATARRFNSAWDRGLQPRQLGFQINLHLMKARWYLLDLFPYCRTMRYWLLAKHVLS